MKSFWIGSFRVEILNKVECQVRRYFAFCRNVRLEANVQFNRFSVEGLIKKKKSFPGMTFLGNNESIDRFIGEWSLLVARSTCRLINIGILVIRAILVICQWISDTEIRLRNVHISSFHWSRTYARKQSCFGFFRKYVFRECRIFLTGFQERTLMKLGFRWCFFFLSLKIIFV